MYEIGTYIFKSHQINAIQPEYDLKRSIWLKRIENRTIDVPSDWNDEEIKEVCIDGEVTCWPLDNDKLIKFNKIAIAPEYSTHATTIDYDQIQTWYRLNTTINTNLDSKFPKQSIQLQHSTKSGLNKHIKILEEQMTKLAQYYQTITLNSSNIINNNNNDNEDDNNNDSDYTPSDDDTKMEPSSHNETNKNSNSSQMNFFWLHLNRYIKIKLYTLKPNKYQFKQIYIISSFAIIPEIEQHNNKYYNNIQEDQYYFKMKKTTYKATTSYSSYPPNNNIPLQYIYDMCNNGQEYESTKNDYITKIQNIEMRFSGITNKWHISFHLKRKKGQNGIYQYDINNRSSKKDLLTQTVLN